MVKDISHQYKKPCSSKTKTQKLKERKNQRKKNNDLYNNVHVYTHIPPSKERDVCVYLYIFYNTRVP